MDRLRLIFSQILCGLGKSPKLIIVQFSRITSREFPVLCKLNCLMKKRRTRFIALERLVLVRRITTIV